MLQLRALLFFLLCLVTNTLAATVPTLISCNNADMAPGIPGRYSSRNIHNINTAHANNILHNIGSQSGGVYKAKMTHGRLVISPVRDPHGSQEVGQQMDAMGRLAAALRPQMQVQQPQHASSSNRHSGNGRHRGNDRDKEGLCACTVMKRNSSPADNSTSPANNDQKNCCPAESVKSDKPVVEPGSKEGKPVTRRFQLRQDSESAQASFH